jgi:hypothetical protein
MNKRNFLIAAGVVLALVSFGSFAWWRYDVLQNALPPAHFAEIVDASDSMHRDCASDVSMVRALVPRITRKGSTFSQLRTGDEKTKLEPQLVFTGAIPASPSTVPFGGHKKAAKAVEEFLQQVSAACAAIEQTTKSPIVKAVRRGMAHLRILGCRNGSGCLLIVHSDLQDQDELASISKGKGATPTPIDNRDIQVILCGYSEGLPDRASVNTDALLESWKRLFTAPVTFAPFCGESIIAGKPSATNQRRLMQQSINSSHQGKDRQEIRSPPEIDLATPLLAFSQLDVYTLGQSFEGTLITGSPGAGKSTTSGKALIYSFLRTRGMGGLVLCAKGTEAKDWIRYARDCGRESDLIIFNAESGHVLDPIWYEFNRGGRGAGDIESIIDLFSTLLAIGKAQSGMSSDRFWELAAEQLMRNVLVLLSLSGEPISIANMHRVVQSLPSRPGEFEEDGWQQESYCAKLIHSIQERKDTLTPEQWSDLDMATQYAFKRWPNFDERPRSSIEMTWAGMADKFLFMPFSRLFCSGRATFIPEMTTHLGKIVIVDFPMLEYGHETGRLINILVKLIFQRAWLRRNLSESPNPVFLWQDEFQYFVTRRDNAFQQTCRGSRAAVVCLTQNILNLSEELGEQQPGSKTKAFLGNLMLKIFHQQNDPDTNNYAAELIGKQYRYLDSFNSDAAGGASVGAAQQLVYNVEPIAFSELAKPDSISPISTAIVYQGGKSFNATVSKEHPRGRNHLTVAFSRHS